MPGFSPFNKGQAYSPLSDTGDLSKRKRVVKEKEIDPETGGTITYKKKYRKDGTLKKYKIRDPKAKAGEKYSKFKKDKQGNIKEGDFVKDPTGAFAMTEDGKNIAQGFKDLGSTLTGGAPSKERQKQDAQKQAFLANWENMSSEERAKVPSVVRKTYGV